MPLYYRYNFLCDLRQEYAPRLTDKAPTWAHVSFSRSSALMLSSIPFGNCLLLAHFKLNNRNITVSKQSVAAAKSQRSISQSPQKSCPVITMPFLLFLESIISRWLPSFWIRVIKNICLLKLEQLATRASIQCTPFCFYCIDVWKVKFTRISARYLSPSSEFKI